MVQMRKIGLFNVFILALICLMCGTGPARTTTFNTSSINNSAEIIDSAHKARYCNGFLYKNLDKDNVFVFRILDLYWKWKYEKFEAVDSVIYMLRFNSDVSRQYKFCSDINYANRTGGDELELIPGSSIATSFLEGDSVQVRLNVHKAQFARGRDSVTLLNEFFWVNFKPEE